MTTYQPATSHSNSIKRPSCSKCGTGMLLFGIKNEAPAKNLSDSSVSQMLNIETRIGKAE